MELSYRRRRRLVALAVAAAVVGGIAAAIALLPTAEKLDRGPTPRGNETAASPPRPKPHPQQRLTAADRARLKSTIALFVSSSVARHPPERSWAVVDPALRE